MNLEFCLGTLQAMIEVLPVTISLTVLSFVASLILAILIAVIDYFRVPVIRQICEVYVSFFRGTPLIPQLFLLYFGIPTFIPSLRSVPAFTVCVIGLTLNSAAYMKEVVRGALLSVSEGQKEAALAHGMTSMQTMFRIVLPQATRVAVPSLFNNLVDIVKGTSMAFTIGVIEITATANLRASVTFNYFEAYMVLMLLYWGIILILERMEAIVEKHLEAGYIR
ncbi:amino acid ABC transporter permease [Lachnospiraceae bacterium KGMB03038]|nr:amino acid ABC transporter permease [Lachnospiraceae bacterium KGMB03038]